MGGAAACVCACGASRAPEPTAPVRASVVVPAATAASAKPPASAAASAKPPASAAASAKPVDEGALVDVGSHDHVGGTNLGLGLRGAGTQSGGDAGTPESGPQVKAPTTSVSDLQLLGVLMPARTALLGKPGGRGWIVLAGDRVGKEEVEAGCVRRWRVLVVDADKVVLKSGGSGCPDATRVLHMKAAPHKP